MSATWNANPINLTPELQLHASADAAGVIASKTVNDVDANDTKLTPDQADAYADMLHAAAAESRAARGAK